MRTDPVLRCMYQEIHSPPDWDGSEGLLAIIVYSSYQADGVKFFTPPSSPQQLAYMKRLKGEIVPPHTHQSYLRTINQTQEVLFIKSGKVRLDIYTSYKRQLVEQVELGPGDVVILLAGGHGLEMLEESEIIEVKQGPYNKAKDKIHFPAAGYNY